MDDKKHSELADYTVTKEPIQITDTKFPDVESGNVLTKWPQLCYKRTFLNCVAALLLVFWMGYQLFNSAEQTLFESQPKHISDPPIQLMDLPSIYLPGKHSDQQFRRLIVVGDVHGMTQSLSDLLNKIDFKSKHDHIILAGDMVSKGPDSPGVVDMAMELGVSCIRGNHEDSVLLAWDELQINDVSPGKSMIEKSVELENGSDEEDFDHQGQHKKHHYHSTKDDRVLAKALGKKRIEWLKKCPVILRVGKIGPMGEVVVVHAGLEAGVALKDQDPQTVMNMRSIKHGAPRKKAGKPWTKGWNKHQKSLKKSDRKTVLYGHDARRGLTIKRYSMGLDSGCVKGKKLTAAVIGPENSYELVHVSCPKGKKS
ncbi:hypothetical protein K3495_g2089 [Podosphaera aphanis]|nr:hypothetical protein K3495_g2089 [Podosphaera aphanis]